MNRIIALITICTFFGAACRPIPKAERVLLEPYAPPATYPFSTQALPLSEEDNWESQGFSKSSDGNLEVWNTQGGTARTRFPHEDLKGYFEVKLAPGSQLTIKFQDAVPFVLTAAPEAEAWGKLAQLSPEIRGGKQPDIWQTVQFSYKAALKDESYPFPPRLEEIVVNGVRIHQEAVVEGQSPSAAPFVLEAEGRLAIRRMALKPITQESTPEIRPVLPLKLESQIAYSYHEKDNWSLLKDFQQAQKVASGETDIMDIRKQSQRSEHFGLRYTGTFTASLKGTYTFYLTSDDGSRMEIDDTEILINDGTHGATTVAHTLELAAGSHSFQIEYFQGGGGASFRADYEGMAVTKRPFYGHSAAPKKAQKTSLQLQPESEPLIQRGFLNYPPIQRLAEKEAPQRRTHAIAVGGPNERHFAVDAGQGTLLMLWRGSFLNTTNMWRGRGNWQNMAPGEYLVARSGRPDFVRLSDINMPWPDSLSAFGTEWKPLGYELDEAGWPLFRYNLAGTEIEDAYTSSEAGLRRMVHISKGADPLSFLVAAGSQIEDLGQGNYVVQGPGYRLVLRDADLDKLYIRETAGGEELIAQFPSGGGSLSTVLSW